MLHRHKTPVNFLFNTNLFAVILCMHLYWCVLIQLRLKQHRVPQLSIVELIYSFSQINISTMLIGFFQITLNVL